MFATDILKVLYAPHKVFKQIIQNPKYWGPLLVLIIFTGAQTGLFFAQYSRTYYEQTSPGLTQLSAYIDTPNLWTATTGTLPSSNTVDIMNTTFYGTSSLQFTLANSSSIFLGLNSLNGSVNCDPSGFQDLYLQIKIVDPSTVPSNANVQLFSVSSANYFQYDLTSTLSNSTSSVWNNLTIPVGSGNWAATGSPQWGNITGLQLNMGFPENTNITVRIGGLFFRGLYKTPIESFTVGTFAATAIFSGLFSFVLQWLAFSVVFFLIIKVLKGPVTWKPLFISMAFALITMAVEILITVAATATLPAQIHYPFEFGYSVQVGAPQLMFTPQLVAMFSTASQAVYNTLIAPQIATFALINTVVVVAAYAWLVGVGATVVRAITEFTWQKSILTAAASVVLTFVILSLLAYFGFV